ncbi:hypothetical protein Tco_0141126, partial [Tanacetum coccineum]
TNPADIFTFVNKTYLSELVDRRSDGRQRKDYFSRITNITVNEKNAYELKGKFLDDLDNNAFSGTNEKDTVEHIEYFLKIDDPINLPNVDNDKLRIVGFPISLAGGGDEIEVSDPEEY